jgi:hypothetical protein
MKARRCSLTSEQDIWESSDKENFTSRRRRAAKPKYIVASDYKLDLAESSDEEHSLFSKEMN